MFIYLASQSPRRSELLAQVGVEHRVISASVTEVKNINETPVEYVQRLALAKAQAGLDYVISSGMPLAPVLGADTLGCLAARVFEKPANKDDAVDMLLALSGRSHDILSAVTITDGQQTWSDLSVTQVTFRPLTRIEINDYCESAEPYDKAGSYAIQGQAAVFIERIEGSYSGVVGLPLSETWQLLSRFFSPNEIKLLTD